MLRLIARRAIDSAIVVLVVVTAVFFISRLVGDPILKLVPIDATDEEIQEFRRNEGLDAPLLVQYAKFLRDAAQLDFGRSLRTGQPAMSEVANRLPATIQLGLVALLFSIALGVPLGVLAAVRRGGLMDVGARFLALVGQALPNFWLGIMLIVLFSVQLKWLPTSGRGGIETLVMPTIALGSFGAASIARLTRAGLIDSLNSDFVRTARAKGLPPTLVVGRHALRNALLPVVTIVGVQMGTIISGSIVVETVFAWPGIGRLMIQSINSNDYAVVQAGVILVSLTIVLANALVDVLYGFIDPRLRVSAS